MKPEARLWQAVDKNMRKPRDRLTRIENSVLSGAPDVNGCLEGEDVWIELKAPTEPKRASTPVLKRSGNHPLLLSQINWMAQQRQAGGIAFILLRTDKHIFLVNGTKHADDINNWTVNDFLEKSMLVCPVPTPVNQWGLLRNVIFTASRHRRLHQHASAQQLLLDLERGQEGVAGDRDAGRSPTMAPGPAASPRSRGRRRGAGDGA